MDYEVLLNGKKLNAEIKDTKLNDRQGAQSDDIKITVLNDSNIDVERGYSLEVSFGGYKSGKFYVDTIASASTTTVIGAISTPLCAKEKRTRHWLKVRLFDIVNDVATNCGISVFYEGVENHYYENLTQYRETDLAFLNRLCTREGYALKTDNNRIVLYNKELIEQGAVVETINVDKVIDNRISFSENSNKVRSVTVKYLSSDRLISYTAERGDIGEAVIINEYVANESEAERFAKGYLKDLTENDIVFDAIIFVNDGISAGCCVELEGYARYNGKYFIVECCHDPEKDQTRIRGRKIQ